jgi:hypothetical protein
VIHVIVSWYARRPLFVINVDASVPWQQQLISTNIITPKLFNTNDLVGVATMIYNNRPSIISAAKSYSVL